MKKKELRNQMLTVLRNLNKLEKINIENKLVEQLLSTSLYKNAKVIGITISSDIEWNTKSIIEAAWKDKKVISVPKCYPIDKSMKFYQIDSFDQLEVGYSNILEPKIEKTREILKSELDLLIVPGFVFDREGYRIGFGGGYYDRYLVDFSGRTVSVLADFQLINKVPRGSFDLPVQHIITETSFINVGHSDLS